jgi:undecaprenyl pyrophosphate synthase
MHRHFFELLYVIKLYYIINILNRLFNKLELYRAIKSYQSRNRRFGGLK